MKLFTINLVGYTVIYILIDIYKIMPEKEREKRIICEEKRKKN